MSIFRRRLLIQQKNVKPKEYIQFADKEVERICVDNWSSDGIRLTKEDAEKVTSLSDKFAYKSINSFDEFIYFTSVEIVTGFRNSTLNKISFHQDVKVIGNSAFLQTKNLSITLNCPNLESIETKAFENSGIISVENLGIINELPENAFAYCTNLEYVKLPYTINYIGDNAFRGNSNLKELIIEALTPPTLGANVFLKTNSELIIYVPDESVESYKIATNWGNYANIIYPISKLVE